MRLFWSLLLVLTFFASLCVMTIRCQLARLTKK